MEKLHGKPILLSEYLTPRGMLLLYPTAKVSDLYLDAINNIMHAVGNVSPVSPTKRLPRNAGRRGSMINERVHYNKQGVGRGEPSSHLSEHQSLSLDQIHHGRRHDTPYGLSRRSSPELSHNAAGVGRDRPAGPVVAFRSRITAVLHHRHYRRAVITAVYTASARVINHSSRERYPADALKPARAERRRPCRRSRAT